MNICRNWTVEVVFSLNSRSPRPIQNSSGSCILLYIITQVILEFWLVLAYDLLEDRRIDDDSTRFNFFEFFEFWIWTNHTSLLSLATNQFASFCIDIRSRQCYLRVCQSGEIWNKKAFPNILIFYYIKQIDSMLPCVCSVIHHRGRQNVVRTSVTHSAAPRVPLFCSYHILTSSVIPYWTHAQQHGIYLLSNSQSETLVNQSDCENVIDNACSFFLSRSWSRSEKNIFFDVDIHLIPKWRPINYSFVCMFISPLCLIFTSKFFCVFFMLKGLINMQTKE